MKTQLLWRLRFILQKRSDKIASYEDSAVNYRLLIGGGKKYVD